MAVGGDVRRDSRPGQPTENRHHELEESEMESDAEDVPRGHVTHSHARGNRDRKRIHRQPDGYSQ